jgi:hypothetical protein
VAWFKVDDKLHSSRKLMKIPRRHRLGAIGLWTVAGSWSADQLTDGLIPHYMIEEWGGTGAVVDALVSVGLWERVSVEFGNSKREFENSTVEFRFSNWAEYQPLKADIEAGREKNAEKLRKWRDRNRVTEPDVTGVHDGYEPVGNPAPDPTRPDPTPTTSKEVEIPRADVMGLCTLLADLIEANGSLRPAIGKGWLDAARLLLDKDGREYAAADRLIRWVQADEFWKGNVLSMGTFRTKYDQLRLAANSQLDKRKGNKQPMTKADQNALEFQRIYGGGNDRGRSFPAIDAGFSA